jgi:SAM-dependent methyltransferase
VGWDGGGRRVGSDPHAFLRALSDAAIVRASGVDPNCSIKRGGFFRIGVRHRTQLYDAYVTSGQAADAAGDFAARGPYLRRLVADHFPRDPLARIVDLGCGNGALLHFCRAAGYGDLEGVDASAEQVAAARERGVDCVVQGDVFAYLRSARDETYDVVVAFDVLEHFTRSEAIDFLREIKRATKPGGRVIVHVPNGESPFVGAVLHGDFTHELAFTRKSLAQLSATLGFAGIACYEDRPIPHGLKSGVRAILWRCVRLAFRLATAIETGDGGAGAVYSRNILAVIER